VKRNLIITTIALFLLVNLSFESQANDERNKVIKAFENSTTLITYRKVDNFDLTKLESIVKSIWKITPYKIIDIEDVDKYMEEDQQKYSKISLGFGTLEAFERSYDYIHLSVSIPYENKEKQKTENLALYSVNIFDLDSPVGARSSLKKRKAALRTHKIEPFWDLAVYKLYLKQLHAGVNRIWANDPEPKHELIHENPFDANSEAVGEGIIPKVAELAGKKIYVMKRDASKIEKIKRKNKDDEAALFSIEIIKEEELYEKLMNAEESFYFIHTDYLKWYYIVNGFTGEVILLPKSGVFRYTMGKTYLNSLKSSVKSAVLLMEE